MPVYHTLGRIPRKRHIVYRQRDGRLYTEELMGNLGFTGPSSLVYHVHQPTQVLSVEPVKEILRTIGFAVISPPMEEALRDGTRLNTPGGNPARSPSSARASAE